MTLKELRKLNLVTHRDAGYFVSGLIIIYCLSGIALNHVDDWNPDFIIEKKTLQVKKGLTKETLVGETLDTILASVGETQYKVIDYPTPTQAKIYCDNASIHIRMDESTAIYEQVTRRPLFYQTNVLHRNSLKGWKWVSDLFALVLIVISVTGLFILKGKQGIKGRGKWLIGGGLMIPLAAILIQYFMK